jgi:hypothetical protein
MSQLRSITKGRTLATSCVLAMLLALAPAAALAQRYRVGKDSVEIPPPAGFITVSTHSLALSDTLRATFPPEMRVIDVFATRAELDTIGSPPSLDRFFSVMIARDHEHFRATEKQFDALLSEGEKELRDDSGKSAIYRREPWAYFYAMGAQLTDFGGTRERYCSHALALAGQIPLFFTSCTIDTGELERAWLRTAMDRWVDSIHHRNLPAAPREPADPAARAVDRGMAIVVAKPAG